LSILATKHPELDFGEVFNILREFSQPGVSRGSQNGQHGNNETQRVWDLSGVRKLADLHSSEIVEIDSVIAYELNPHKQMVLPEIGKLSLESPS
jgi:hypothetical protein